jgi:hypothetical protein
MKSVKLGLIGALVITSTLYGGQPPDVVTSDSQLNTAMGTQALENLLPSVSGSYGNTPLNPTQRAHTTPPSDHGHL